MLYSRGLKFLRTQKRVVDFQDPVGQATRIIPYELSSALHTFSKFTSINQSFCILVRVASGFNIRITTFSQ
jgi:hypothetical protein